MKRRFFLIYLSLLLCSIQRDLFADEVYLKNGDRLSGEIVEDSEKGVIIETEVLGRLTLKRGFVERVVTDREGQRIEAEDKPAEEETLWKRELSIGYTRSSGNTQDAEFSASFYANRKTQDNEITLKASSFYASSDRKMNSQKWYGMARYAFSFWERKWYNFYKLESDHDRFADVDYRIIPSLGMGYWFNDGVDWKAMTELALGFEYTDFRNATEDSEEGVLIPRAFFEKRLWGESRIRQDLYLYPLLEDIEVFRLHSETIFENPINGKMSLRLSVVDDYDSEPAEDAKKNDVRVISSLVYSF